jgi:hypothetical protein
MYRFVEFENKILIVKKEAEGKYEVDYDIGIIEVKKFYKNGKEVNKNEILGEYFSNFNFNNGDLFVSN